MIASAVSFRDPAGSCCVLAERVFRHVTPGSIPAFQTFLALPTAAELERRRCLIPTRRLTGGELETAAGLPGWPAGFPPAGAGEIYEHEKVFFPSYPHEWPAEMLWAAAVHTLDLAQALLPVGWGLKDATPQNVLFDGPQPVFIDLLSFEPRRPDDPLWNPYAQFVRNFLLPLLAERLWRTPLADVFLTRRDGLEPEELYRYCGFWTRWRPAVFSLVTLPVWLARRARHASASLYRQQSADPEKARFILESLLRRLRRIVSRLEPRRGQHSGWSDYMATHSYTEPAFAAKERFVRETLAEYHPRDVLDVGANTGHFSGLAAESGARVVAIDIDPTCVGAIWRRARDRAQPILPLVVNLARPTPALGWNYRENPSFLQRAAGRFDCVLMLAVLHHLLVTERIPLAEVLALAARLTTRTLVIEFVAPDDDMFRQLTRGRDELHAGLTVAAFEAASARWFTIEHAEDLPETRRRLYRLHKRSEPS